MSKCEVFLKYFYHAILLFMKNGKWEIKKGDCLLLMKQLKPKSIDMIFADPPYNLSNDGITCKSGKMVSVNKGKWDKSNGLDNDSIFHEEWILQPIQKQGFRLREDQPCSFNDFDCVNRVRSQIRKEN